MNILQDFAKLEAEHHVEMERLNNALSDKGIRFYHYQRIAVVMKRIRVEHLLQRASWRYYARNSSAPTSCSLLRVRWKAPRRQWVLQLWWPAWRWARPLPPTPRASSPHTAASRSPSSSRSSHASNRSSRQSAPTSFAFRLLINKFSQCVVISLRIGANRTLPS